MAFGMPHVGGIGRVRITDADHAMAFSDKEAAKIYRKISKDTHLSVEQKQALGIVMLEEGRMFILEPNVRVRILGYGWSKTDIQVVEGAHEGLICCTLPEWVSGDG